MFWRELGGRLGKRVVLVPLAMITLSQVIGCGPEYEYDYTSYKIRGGGIINDTTVIFLEESEDRYSDNSYMGLGTEYRNNKLYLYLADIRFEKIYWKKEITPIISTYNTSYLQFDIIDSILFFYTTKGVFKETTSYRIDRIAVVHIDNKFQQSEKIELKYKEIELKGEGWEYDMYERIRPWRDGLMLAYRAGAYALLDTMTGTMKLWQPAGEFEWLNECVDFKWNGIGGLCLKNLYDAPGFVLLKNGVDTLATGHRGTSPYFNGNSIVSAIFVYLISKQGFISEEPLDIRFDGRGGFYDLYGNLLMDYGEK
ncbi:MAG: hypothetical protein FWC26_06685 [Fibromonadales bacterium]|nr:hypothetical protein [Fibromonadales bacterium]